MYNGYYSLSQTNPINTCAKGGDEGMEFQVKGREHQELDLPVQPSSNSLSSAELPQVESECPACQLLLRYPQRLTCCQRHFCGECIEKLLKDGKPCPSCNEADFSTLPDDSDECLGLKSTNKDEGVGELASDLEEHANSKPSPESQLDGCPQDHPPVQASKPPHHTQGRYDSEFVREQSECPICLQVLRDPQKVTCCGNSYCKVCIDRIVKDGKPCPTCNSTFLDSSPPSRDDQPPEDSPIQPARPDPPVQRSRPLRPSSRALPCGYDCEFVERPPAQVQCECPVCLLVLRDPQQVKCCGNSFCKVCIDHVVKDGTPCPTCNGVAFSIFPNQGLRRTLGGFRVCCSNKDEGCEWVGELGDLERHLNSKPSPERQLEGCLFEEVACVYCACLFQRRYISPHQSNDECPKRPYACKHCGHDATYEEVMQGHYRALVEVQSREPEQQVDLLGCPLEIVTCDFHGVGCQVELPRRDVPAHLSRKVVSHSVFLLSTAQRTTSNVDTVQSGQNEMQASLARLQEMVDAQDGRIKEFQDENRRLQASLQEAVTAQEDENGRLQTSLQEAVTAQEDENRRLQASLQEAVTAQEDENGRLQTSLQEAVTVQEDENRRLQASLQEAVTAKEDENRRLQASLQEAVTAQEDENRRLQERQRSTNARLQKITHGQSQALFWGLVLVLALAAIGIGIAVGKVRDEQTASAESKPESFPVDSGIQVNESENVAVTLAQTLEQVEKDVATEKSERDKMAKSLEQVEKDVATEKSERGKMAKSLEQVEKDVATEKSERGRVAKSLEQVEKDVATEKSGRGKMAKSLEQVGKDVATEKSERENTTESLAQVKKEMATAKRERRNTTNTLAQVKWEVAKEKTARQQVTDTLAQNLAKVKTEVATEKSLVLNHLKMIPHEVAPLFEFTMHDFQKYKADDRTWESPPFYTHSHGYTLCIVIRAKTYWSQTKYISVYAYLMPGVFDDDLKWPFRGNVTIELVNQAESSRWNPVSSRKESHADSFDFAAKTRDNREISQRVMSGKKALYGKPIHYFIAHSALDYDAVEGTQYLKDDSLKFRISKVTNIL